ncbi:hypothetical protein [Streptomyces misionensis]|uniref:hypothetical protein n=1 Tax=Streptomyces misionensis TaxID=67331 RepID=UPI00396BC8FB
MSSEWMTPEQIRQRQAAEVMEGQLGTAIYEAVIWARKQLPSTSSDELWLNPQDEGAAILIGGTLMGYPVCASERVPRGEALVWSGMARVYVRSGEKPTGANLTDPMRPDETP